MEHQRLIEHRRNHLLDQVNKIILIEDLIPWTKDFLLGFILKDSNNVGPEIIKDLTKVIELLFDILECQIITKHIFAELVVVLSNVCQNIEKHHIKSLMDFYQNSIGEIVNDPDYLKKKYFQNAGKIKKNQQSKIQEPKLVSKIVQPEKGSLHRNIIEPQIGDLLRNNSDLAECPVCLVQIKHQNISVLGCGHIIHKECFEQCMKESIVNKRFPLKCPFQECSKHIQSQDIEQYLTKDLVEKYYQFTLHNFVDKNSKNISWCPTPGCSNAFEFDQGIAEFNCAKCSKIYCLKCKTEAHGEISCQQNQEMMHLSEEDKKFLDFVKGAKYKQCPKCKFWVQKNHGCCHMTCRCSYQFCYVCGGEYGSCNCQNQYENYYGSPEGSQVQDEEDEEEPYGSQEENAMEEYDPNIDRLFDDKDDQW